MAAPSRTVGRGGDRIVSARLLILQSKRMLLMGAISKARFQGLPEPDEKVARLQSEVKAARDSYRDCVLKFGSVDSPQYWLVAYDVLVEAGERLTRAMLDAAANLQQPEGSDVAADAARLDRIIESWRDMARAAMTAEVA